MQGLNKLLLRVGETSLVRRTALEIAKVDLSEMVAVTGFEHDKIKKELRPFSFDIAYNKYHLTGMHSSIREGLKAIKNPCDGFFICLADQPYFTSATLQILMDAFTDQRKIIHPTFNGERGQPVLIGADFIPEIIDHEDGDHGCTYLFDNHPDALIAVPVQTSLRDIDRPQDYQAYLENPHG
jgi:molybdenum cofactor cytidylyltransferase